MQIPPLDVLAAWPAPNYVNPETHGPANIIVFGILMGISAIFLTIRIYTRIAISRGFGIDDVLIILAFIPATAFAILGIYATLYLDWNKHVWDLRPENAKPGLQLSLASQLIFDLATTFTKLSMVALIYRVVAPGLGRTRHVVVIIGGIIGLNSLLFVFITMFQCRPAAAYWTLSFAPQKCIDEASHALAAGIINTVTDLIIVLLPINTIRNLSIPRKQRVVVYLLFGGGLLASAAGGVRTYFTFKLTSSPDHDSTWNSYFVMLSSSVELYVGIICASIPATKAFFARYIPQLIGSTGSSRRDVTEPLAERARKEREASLSSFRHTDDIESVSSQVPLGRVEFKPGHARKITAEDLNKPLPPVLIDVPFKIEVDRADVVGQRDMDERDPFEEESLGGKVSAESTRWVRRE